MKIDFKILLLSFVMLLIAYIMQYQTIKTLNKTIDLQNGIIKIYKSK